MVDWISLGVPFAYIGILVTSLATFSSLYRKRKAARSFHLTPYFPPHTPRDVYLTLLHNDTPKPPDSILRSALLLRACENIRRILTIRTRKPALQTLLARGSVGDDLWQRLLRAETELTAEVQDCVNEANALAKDWGTSIFQTANEMVNREILGERLGKITEGLDGEKRRWVERREGLRRDALVDLGASDAASVPASTMAEAQKATETKQELPVVTDFSGPQVQANTTSTGSDEDGVLVEKDNPDTSIPAASGTPSVGTGASGGGGGGGGGKKKKKGKK